MCIWGNKILYHCFVIYGACHVLLLDLLCTRLIVNKKSVTIFRIPTKKEKIMSSPERKRIQAEKPSWWLPYRTFSCSEAVPRAKLCKFRIKPFIQAEIFSFYIFLLASEKLSKITNLCVWLSQVLSRSVKMIMPHITSHVCSFPLVCLKRIALDLLFCFEILSVCTGLLESVLFFSHILLFKYSL